MPRVAHTTALCIACHDTQTANLAFEAHHLTASLARRLSSCVFRGWTSCVGQDSVNVRDCGAQVQCSLSAKMSRSEC
jgi:hypothetical protein